MDPSISLPDARINPASSSPSRPLPLPATSSLISYRSSVTTHVASLLSRLPEAYIPADPSSSSASGPRPRQASMVTDMSLLAERNREHTRAWIKGGYSKYMGGVDPGFHLNDGGRGLESLQEMNQMKKELKRKRRLTEGDESSTSISISTSGQHGHDQQRVSMIEIQQGEGEGGLAKRPRRENDDKTTPQTESDVRTLAYWLAGYPLLATAFHTKQPSHGRPIIPTREMSPPPPPRPQLSLASPYTTAPIPQRRFSVSALAARRNVVLNLETSSARLGTQFVLQQPPIPRRLRASSTTIPTFSTTPTPSALSDAPTPAMSSVTPFAAAPGITSDSTLTSASLSCHTGTFTPMTPLNPPTQSHHTQGRANDGSTFHQTASATRIDTDLWADYLNLEQAGTPVFEYLKKTE